ncbi:MAG: hypothetical protein K0S09_2514 [Sphingobacteriaceae bacterium]|jgi:hypothetical protein|nr:hypothetical protein [Sphingobacteriaceae bacterium]
MKTSEEINRQKHLLQDLKLKEKLEFIKSLPFHTERFNDLFDFLNQRLTEVECDDTLVLTTEYLQENGLYSEKVIDFLKENGGYCDCEVLNNVEERFEGL